MTSVNCSGENKRVHLQMIQGIVNRMGGNLFFLKGWAVTLIIGLFAASIALNGNWYLQPVLVGVFLFFWAFDAYFLSLERCFRDLYDVVRELEDNNIDFSMDISEQKRLAKNTWGSALFSPTLVVFYPLLAIVMIVVINFI